MGKTLLKAFLKTPLLSAISVFSFLFVFLIFQNCSPTFKTAMSEDDLNSLSNPVVGKACTNVGDSCQTAYGTGFCAAHGLSFLSTPLFCREEVCTDNNVLQTLSGEVVRCLPAQDFLRISYQDSTRMRLTSARIYPILVLNSSDEVLNTSASSITAVSGACEANKTWAPLQRPVSPWTFDTAGTATHFKSGWNLFNFSRVLKSEMDGCVFRACVKSSSGTESCLTIETDAAIITPPPPPPPPPTTCSGANPGPINAPKPCSLLLGPTYAGDYTETTTYTCVGTAWTPATTNNSATACTARQCPQPSPANPPTSTANCSSIGSIFYGQYTVTSSHVCDTSNYTWKLQTSDTSNTCPTVLTRLSSLQNVNGTVEIPANTTAYIDNDINVGLLRINGTLVCGANNRTFNLLAETIHVNGNFDCGTEAAPYAGKLNISLKRNPAIIPRTGRELNGNVFGPSAQQIAAQKQILDASMAATQDFRAMIITGSLKLFGITKGQVSRLTQTLNVGVNSISVDAQTNWAVGDELAIAPTSYDPNEHEKFTITAINGNSITLNRAAQFRHYGGVVENFNSHGRTFTLNQRAEVINLTRNIKIEAHDKLSNGTDANQLNPEQVTSEPGGHVMVHNGGRAQISAVEFYKMGQAGLMGRYPFHWHRLGTVSNQFIKNSSVHKSFQRCITVHATNNAVVENNFCYDFRGHGFFLEDGNEVNNTLRFNIGIGAKVPHASKLLLSSDDPAQTVGLRFPGPSIYWISHPQNTVTDNIAAGVAGTGFWNSFESPAHTASTTAFNRNIAHSTFVGHTWDGARRADQNSNNPNNHNDRKIDIVHYSPPTVPTFDGLVAYKNQQAGIYFRGNTVIFNNNLMADNSWSFFLAYNQKVKNSVLVGKSQNVTSALPRHIGAVLYDGPFEFENIDFYNFNQQSANTMTSGDSSPLPFYAIGGSEKLTNVVRNLRFLPAVQYKVLVEKHVGDPWVEKHLSNSIRDLDGSLTGLAGGVLVSSTDFTSGAGCSANMAFAGMKLCPANSLVSTLALTSTQYGGNVGVSYPFLVRKYNTLTGQYADSHDANDMAMVNAHPNIMLNRKVNLVESANTAFEVHIKKDYTNLNRDNELHFQYYSENGARTSPILKVVGYGSDCRLNGGQRFNSLAELNSANQSGYYSHQSSFFIRLRSNALYWPIVGGVNIAQPYFVTHTISCNNAYVAESDYVDYHNITNPTAPTGEIMGYIDNVAPDGTVYGWACLKGSSKQIWLHVYANAPAGGPNASFVGAAFANNGSEAAVAQICQDTSMTSHRFNFRPTVGGLTGRQIYIHGINGFNNTTITGSGNFTFK